MFDLFYFENHIVIVTYCIFLQSGTSLQSCLSELSLSYLSRAKPKIIPVGMRCLLILSFLFGPAFISGEASMDWREEKHSIY